MQNLSNERIGHHGFDLGVVRQVAHKITRNRDEADEVIQLAVIRLLQVEKSTRISNHRGYAQETTLNAARDMWRLENRYRSSEVPIDENEVRSREFQDASMEARRKANRHLIQSVLDKLCRNDLLDELDVKIINLITEGDTQAEIARSLNIDRKTVHNRINKIRELVKGLDPDPPDTPPTSPGGGSGRRSSAPIRGDPEDRISSPTNSIVWEYLPCKHVKRPVATEHLRGEAPMMPLRRQAEHRNTTKEPPVQRFKELFLQLPAFREDPGETDPGLPDSLRDIEEMLLEEGAR